MNWINSSKKVIYVLSINILVLIGIFVVLELGFRLTFPEFKGHIHSEELTMGKHIKYMEFYGHKTRSRVDENKNLRNSDEPLVIIFGDSISNGYGHAYNDLWWKKLEEFLAIRKINYKFISVGGYGYNFTDIIENVFSLENFLELTSGNVAKVIYQFNYNDITPYQSQNLKSKTTGSDSYWVKFSKFRYEHLNKSVLARVLQHYAGILKRKTSGSCYDRSFDALGQYSYTFGSKSMSKKAELEWQVFEKNVTKFSKFLKSLNIDFEILIAPILFQIDTQGIHPRYNDRNLDFTCSSIEPKRRLLALASKYDVGIYDPENYLQKMFNERVEDRNFEPFYFTADDNHFTPLASGYIAQFMAENWFSD